MEDEVGDAALPEEEGMGEEGGDDGQHESPGVDAANSGASGDTGSTVAGTEQNTAQHDGTPITFKPLHSHKRRTGITKPPVWVSCMVSAYPHHNPPYRPPPPCQPPAPPHLAYPPPQSELQRHARLVGQLLLEAKGRAVRAGPSLKDGTARGALVSRLVSLHTASVQNELLKHAITHCTALRGRAEDLGEALQLLYEGVVVAASHVTGRSKTTLEAAKW